MYPTDTFFRIPEQKTLPNNNNNNKDANPVLDNATTSHVRDVDVQTPGPEDAEFHFNYFRSGKKSKERRRSSSKAKPSDSDNSNSSSSTLKNDKSSVRHHSRKSRRRRRYSEETNFCVECANLCRHHREALVSKAHVRNDAQVQTAAAGLIERDHYLFDPSQEVPMFHGPRLEDTRWAMRSTSLKSLLTTAVLGISNNFCRI